MKQQETTWVFGDLYTFHLSTPEIAIIEVETKGTQGPPLHSHNHEEESLYVLEGELEVTHNGATVLTKKDDFIHFPKGTLHTFRNVAAQGSRILVMITPGNFAQLFREIGIQDATAAQDPTQLHQAQSKLLSLADQYGLQIAGPPPATSTAAL